MTPILETRSLSYIYPGGHRALDALDIAFARGERHVVLGSNGAGKSTLFMLLNGVLQPSAGQVLFDGQALTYDRAGLKRIRSKVGVLFQDPDVQLISASLREDVSFGPMNLGLDADTVRKRVSEALRVMRLESLADRPVHALSYGQKRRAGLAGLLAMEPEVLILDEPTSGLDNRAKGEFMELLSVLQERGITVILSTHSMDLAYAWADHAHVLECGKRVAGCSAGFFYRDFPAFASYGLGLPGVLRIHQALLDCGVLEKEQPVPKDHDGLLALIRESQCC